MAEGDPPFRYIPPADPNIGRVVNGHVLESLLARGGMGAAYVAAHKALLRSKSVVKLVLAEVARHPQGIFRFHLEAEALTLLKHDNIVRLVDFGVLEDGQLYLRFELIEGTSLERYVAEHGGRLDLREAVYLIFQCCNALQYAHDLRVIHRDLKPDNIMIELSPPGATLKRRIRILDFGIARVVASAMDPTGSGVVLGTPRYMAPEQVTNAANVTGAADVFAIAQVLYWMLTGTMPWGIPESDIAIYHKQRTEPPAWPPEELVPPAVAKVIMRCLSLNPADRPSMRELAIALACAIPAEDGLESGTQILAKTVPDWVNSSPPNAVTLPRSAVADPTAGAAPSQSAVNVPSDDRDRERQLLGADTPAATGSRSTSVQPVPPMPHVATASAQPRSLAASIAAAASAEASSLPSQPPRSLPSAPSIDVSAQPSLSSSPVLAVLPTGLASQKHPAQNPTWLESATATREPSIAVAAEIELATGTPGPRPYAHAELPRVMVSNTQLTGVTAPPDAGAAQPHPGAEGLPILVLDPAARSTRRRRHFVALGLSALAVIGVLCVVVVRLGSHTRVSGDARSEGSGHGAAPAPSVAAPTDSGVVEPEHHVVAAATVPVDAGRLSPGRDASDASVEASRTEGKAKPVTTTSTDARSTAAADSQRTSSTPETAPQVEPRSAPQPQPPAVKKGELVIEVDTWAIIWLNGKQDEAPYRAKLPAGPYRLRMQHDEKDEIMTVIVRPGETKIVKRNW